MIKIIANHWCLAAVVFASTLLAHDARAGYRYLCTSVPSACEYTGPDAPVLRADVCWDGTRATLKSGSCPSNAWPYYVDHGEVIDPITNEVAAYVPLDWACDHPSLCVDGPVPPEADGVPICCTNGECVPLSDAGCGGDKLMCKDGVTNADGTVTCFSGDEVP